MLISEFCGSRTIAPRKIVPPPKTNPNPNPNPKPNRGGHFLQNFEFRTLKRISQYI